MNHQWILPTTDSSLVNHAHLLGNSVLVRIMTAGKTAAKKAWHVFFRISGTHNACHNLMHHLRQYLSQSHSPCRSQIRSQSPSQNPSLIPSHNLTLSLNLSQNLNQSHPLPHQITEPTAQDLGNNVEASGTEVSKIAAVREMCASSKTDGIHNAGQVGTLLPLSRSLLSSPDTRSCRQHAWMDL